MTNYDTLKEYEAHKEPLPSYNEYNKLRKLPLKCFQLEEDNSALVVINKDMCKKVERLQEQLKETQQELQIRINDNADMYAKLCNVLMQLEEANAIIKDMRPFIQGSMKRETFTRILNYEEKWRVE